MSDNFFRIDRRVWAEVCRLGMGPALAYLVLACGTGQNNRDTNWSVNAVHKYGGRGVDRAKKDVLTLCQAHYIHQTNAGSKPHYVLVSWLELKETRKEASRAACPLSKSEQHLYEIIKNGGQPNTYDRGELAKRMVSGGWLFEKDGSYSVTPEPESSADTASNFIWLPNSIVMGTSAGELAPIVRLRSYGDVMALRLLIDLYHDHNLRDDGGVDRRVFRQKFDRALVVEHGVHGVWEFQPGGQWTNSRGAAACHIGPKSEVNDFFDRISILLREGLLQIIPHLCEEEELDSEIIHAYGTDWSQNGLGEFENAVGAAADEAARAMANQLGFATWSVGSVRFLAPVPRNFPRVQMVGIARLRYRPRTRRTAEWWEKSQVVLRQHLQHYQQLKANAEKSSTARGA